MGISWGPGWILVLLEVVEEEHQQYIEQVVVPSQARRGLEHIRPEVVERIVAEEGTVHTVGDIVVVEGTPEVGTAEVEGIVVGDMAGVDIVVRGVSRCELEKC